MWVDTENEKRSMHDPAHASTFAPAGEPEHRRDLHGGRCRIERGERRQFQAFPHGNSRSDRKANPFRWRQVSGSWTRAVAGSSTDRRFPGSIPVRRRGSFPHTAAGQPGFRTGFLFSRLFRASTCQPFIRRRCLDVQSQLCPVQLRATADRACLACRLAVIMDEFRRTWLSTCAPPGLASRRSGPRTVIEVRPTELTRGALQTISPSFTGR